MTRLRRLTPTICAFHLGFSLEVVLTLTLVTAHADSLSVLNGPASVSSLESRARSISTTAHRFADQFAQAVDSDDLGSLDAAAQSLKSMSDDMKKARDLMVNFCG